MTIAGTVAFSFSRATLMQAAEWMVRDFKPTVTILRPEEHDQADIARAAAIGELLLKQANRKRQLDEAGRIMVRLSRQDAQWVAQNLIRPRVLGSLSPIGALGIAARKAIRARGRRRLSGAELKSGADGSRAMIEERHRKRLRARLRFDGEIAHQLDITLGRLAVAAWRHST